MMQPRKLIVLTGLILAFCYQGACQAPKNFVYVSKVSGYAQVFIRQDGVDRQLTFSGDNYRPKLSPDGQQIIFDSDKTGLSQLYLINVDGSNLKTLSTGHWNETGASWSPDGALIVYSSDENRRGYGDIYTRQLNGKMKKRLTSNDYLEWRPVFCTDLSCVVYSAEVDGNEEIFQIELETTKQSQLTVSDGRDGWASINQSGTKILFHSERTGQSEIFEMNLDGSDQRQLTNYAWDGFFPTYVEANGLVTGILYSSEYNNHNDWDIYHINYQTGKITKVVDGKARNFQPHAFMHQN